MILIDETHDFENQKIVGKKTASCILKWNKENTNYFPEGDAVLNIGEMEDMFLNLGFGKAETRCILSALILVGAKFNKKGVGAKFNKRGIDE